MVKLKALPWPPTSNHRYIPSGKRLILSPQHRDYKRLLGLYLLSNYGDIRLEEKRAEKLKVLIEYTGPESAWFTKAGTIRQIDVDGRVKTLLDVIFPFLGLDDSQIFELNLKKVVGGNELMANVYVEEIVNGN